MSRDGGRTCRRNPRNLGHLISLPFEFPQCLLLCKLLDQHCLLEIEGGEFEAALIERDVSGDLFSRCEVVLFSVGAGVVILCLYEQTVQLS